MKKVLGIGWGSEEATQARRELWEHTAKVAGVE